MRVIVYTLPNCVQCESTKRMLTKGLVEFEEVAINRSSKAREKIQEWGYTQAPVVEVGDQHWSGFRMERLQGLINAVHREESQK